MKIKKVVCSKGKTGFYFDDQKAIKNNAVSDGAAFKGKPVTEGFTAIRQAGESISVMLLLEDGQIAHGDCVAVQYSGAASLTKFSEAISSIFRRCREGSVVPC